jgi:hypothetical protein
MLGDPNKGKCIFLEKAKNDVNDTYGFWPKIPDRIWN